MTIQEIKNLLDRGDYVKIARMVGYTDLSYGRTYVYMVLSGRRNAKKGIGKKIIEAALVVATRNTSNGHTNTIESKY